MKEIKIKFVPREQIRNRDFGDYRHFENGDSEILVAETGNPDYNFLVQIHEAIEMYISLRDGLPEEEINLFDKKFVKEQEQGLRPENQEPGNAKDSPYRKYHRLAENIERQLAFYLGVDWQDYEQYFIDHYNDV